MSIKVLFLVMVLSVGAVIGAALAAFIRVRSHLKSRPATARGAPEQASGETAQPPEQHKR